jgi:glycosyltransferase 2 family protein
MEEDMPVATPSALLRRGILIGTAVALVAAIALAGTNVLQQSLALAAESDLLSASLITVLLPLATASYALRVLRWHLLARRVAPGVLVPTSAHGQIVGFGFAPTPGRVAELYKLKLLSASTGVPVAQFVPAALVERLTDLAGFGLVVAAGTVGTLAESEDSGQALALGSETPIWLGLGGLALLVFALAPRARRQDVGKTTVAMTRALLRRAPALPGGHRLVAILAELELGGRQVQDPRTLVLAVACVAVGRTCDSLVLWHLATAIGYPISVPLALLIFGSAGLVGGITFSPGGLGAAELALGGLLVARGLPLAGATVVALGTRVFTFWLWVSLGLMTFAAGHALALLAGPRTPVNQSPRLSDDRSVENVARSAS